MENVNRTGDFFSPLPGVRGFCGVPRGRFSFFRGHGGCRFPAGCAPHSLPRGENASRPVEERRQGNPFDGVPLDPSATTQRGGTRVSPPLWKHPPWGTGAGNPPATAKRPCPPPFCERGASSFYSALSTGRCQSTPKSQCAAAKREAEGIRKCPQLFHANMRLSG